MAKNTSGRFNESIDFLELVVNGHIIAAAMHYFGLSSVEDQPKHNSFPFPKSLDAQWKVLSAKIGKLVDTYVIVQRFQDLQPKSTMSIPVSAMDIFHNPHAARLRSEHSYCLSPMTQVVSEHSYANQSAQPRTHHRRLPPQLFTSSAVPRASRPLIEIVPDGVFNYACSVLNDGLLILELRDAIHEGDGPRILRCWKFMLIYFKNAGHHKYALEAFNLLAQVHVTSSPRMKKQLLWSRVVNTRGGAGNNIPVDLHNEHLNRKLKDIVSGVGANIAEDIVVQASKSLNAVNKICDNFDSVTNIKPDSIHHTKKSSDQDLKKVVYQLSSESHVFSYIPGRKHRAFPNMQPNLVRSVNVRNLFEWLDQKQKHLANTIKFKNIFKTK